MDKIILSIEQIVNQTQINNEHFEIWKREIQKLEITIDSITDLEDSLVVL